MATAMTDLQISPEGTPNPNTIKLNVNRFLLEKGSLDFPDRESAQSSPLPRKLFETESLAGVFVGKTFVSITKREDAEWESLTPVVEAFRDALLSDEPLLSEQDRERAAEASKGSEADGEIEQKIREILDSDIRPAVAMDGGDITFYGYEDGVVTLHLQGACSACPSATMTLKMGVENRLKSLIPEVTEVVQI